MSRSGWKSSILLTNCQLTQQQVIKGRKWKWKTHAVRDDRGSTLTATNTIVDEIIILTCSTKHIKRKQQPLLTFEFLSETFTVTADHEQLLWNHQWFHLLFARSCSLSLIDKRRFIWFGQEKDKKRTELFYQRKISVRACCHMSTHCLGHLNSKQASSRTISAHEYFASRSHCRRRFLK